LEWQTVTPPDQFADLALRLLAAFACGACLGLNRDLHHKSAGFRTFSLVSIGSALITIAALRIGTVDSAAASRVMQGILTGIGFLGAGVILRRQSSDRVTGLTTAAAIWSTAGLGVACGLGEYPLVVLGLALMLLTLLVGGRIERFVERRVRARQAAGDPEVTQHPPDDKRPR
jgi:putative Mg2+ transporter-C (MgtC) family protein